MSKLSLFNFSLISLLAFAANSVLCRLALKVEQVDPISFTAIRLLSAAFVLLMILIVKKRTQFKNIQPIGSLAGASYLLIYAAGFSYAYMSLSTATGALALFACVQFTMLFKSWLDGNKLREFEKVGISLSLIGFIYFVYPELDKPSLLGCILMGLAGLAWGMYSLIGVKSTQPLVDTAGNFIRLTPVAILALIYVHFESGLSINTSGLLYTISSGAFASGLGYTLWYYVLPQLPPSIAAVSQLSVPIWAAFGGVLFVAEPISWHLTLSSGLILGGIFLVLMTRFRC